MTVTRLPAPGSFPGAVPWAAALALLLGLAGGVASAYWTTGALPGSSGAAAAVTVRQGSTPSVSVSGRAVTVSWAATPLSNGDPVSGYVVQRYDAATRAPASIGAGCSGTVTTTTCTESRVPAGQWVYSVTPTVGTSWRGAPSASSSPVTVDSPRLTLATTQVRPGTAATGTVTGFLPGETLRYRLDSPTGPELTGTLAGSATPAVVPAGGDGAAGVTVPAGTTDGSHTVYAVAAPSGDAAAATILVDGTAPPAPVLTLTPTATSGDTVTFAWTEAEASATVECRLDTAAFAPCQSPVDYGGLAAGSHTFQARAVDTVGNASAATSYTWTVNTTVPVTTIGFPQMDAAYNDAGLTAGCGTPTTGDVCGSAEDDTAVLTVQVSLRRLGTGLYWNGAAFSAAAETWLTATGTTDWRYNLAAASLPDGGYTLRARASDGGNLGYDARTFTVDRTAPPAPVLTSVPPSPSGSTATVEFADTETTAAFQCRLDAGTWDSCSSPQRYAALADGSHTVAVRAVDAAGNASAGTPTTWTVDGSPPTVSAAFPAATSYNASGWTAGCGTPSTGDLCGSAADVGSGVALVGVSIYRADTNSYWDGTAFSAAGETWLAATGTGAWSYPFAVTAFPGDGRYTVRWRAVDAAGNTTIAGLDLTIDTTAPAAPRIVRAPSDPSGPTAQLDFTIADPQAITQCRLDGGTWTPCSASVTFSGLSSGSHTFAVRAVDVAGNTSDPASYTWTVDAGAPSVTIGHPGGGRSFNDAGYAAGCGTPAGDLCGTASDPQGNLAGVEVSIQRQSTSLYWDGTGFTSPTEIFLPATGTSSWSYPLAAAAFPAEDQYAVRARATDLGGLSTVDTVSFRIDRTAPAAPTIISGPTGTTRGNDTFAFSGEAGATFECRVDAAAWQTCTSPRVVGTLADGSHVFAVRAVDAAGNTGSTATRTWTVDATGPTVGTTFPGAGGRYNSAGYTAGCVAGAGDICGSASDPGSGVVKVEISLRRSTGGLYLSGGTFSSPSQTWLAATGTTAWSYPLAATTFPADGDYTLSVRVTDGVGNTATTTTTFTIDRTAPTAAGFGTTNAGTVGRLDAGDSFTLTFSEPVAPGSIIAGWSGASPQNVVVRATGNGGSKDKLTIYNATNSVLLPLGTLSLGSSDFVTRATTFGASGTPSTLTVSGSSVVVTLGTPSPATGVGLVLTATNVAWTPAGGVTDLAGNGAATTAYTETDGDRDF